MTAISSYLSFVIVGLPVYLLPIALSLYLQQVTVVVFSQSKLEFLNIETYKI